MKICAPISRIDEIAPLAAAGVDEIYFGFVPPAWIAQFNTGAVNRRYFGNLGRENELEVAVDLAHRHGARLFLVLNAQHYAEQYHEALIELAARFERGGGDAVIVADLALIAALRDDLPDLAVHVSSVANCRNSAMVALLRDLGAHRVILPRDVTLDEIERMAQRVPDVELEVFVLNDGCVFEEGLCHSLHLPPKLGGPLCIDRRDMVYRASDGQPMPPRMTRAYLENEADYHRWLWYRFGCGFATTDEGYPYGPCGLCAIHRLQRIGIESLKIAGREGATSRKIKSVEMVRRILDAVRQGANAQTAAILAVGIRNAFDHCASGYMCYYPETKWEGAGDDINIDETGSEAERMT